MALGALGSRLSASDTRWGGVTSTRRSRCSASDTRSEGEGLGTRDSALAGVGSVLGALGARHSPVVLGTRRWCSALPEMVAYAGKMRSGGANAGKMRMWWTRKRENVVGAGQDAKWWCERGKVRMWWARVRCEWWGRAVQKRYETVACACG